MTREDWRSLSGILGDYLQMCCAGDWARERSLREMLAVWLRDHDMPQAPLESDDNLGFYIQELPDISIDPESGEVVEAKLVWLMREDGHWTRAVRFEMRFYSGDGDYVIRARCK